MSSFPLHFLNFCLWANTIKTHSEIGYVECTPVNNFSQGGSVVPDRTVLFKFFFFVFRLT